MFRLYTRFMTLWMRRNQCWTSSHSNHTMSTVLLKYTDNKNDSRLCMSKGISYSWYRHFKSIKTCIQEQEDNCLNICTNIVTNNNCPIRNIRLYGSVVNKYKPEIDEYLFNYLHQVEEQYEESLNMIMNPDSFKDEDIRLANKTVTELKVLMEVYKVLKQKLQEIEDLNNIIRGDDQEMITLAEEERATYQDDLKNLHLQILSILVPPERADHNDVVLELTAGVGGQEAMLFVGEMFDMYARFIANKGWQWTSLSCEESDSGGLRRASASVSGQSVYSFLKYEGGVHRVQRVPQTEKSGRIHTSTMAVAIIPQPSEIDVVISPKDLKVETYKASGAGGQHVNTTNSAVRVTHIPSGMVAECQTERSQIKNKASAMKILRSRMYEMELEAQTQQTRSQRKIQVGTRGRSEKIRTYNFSQDRITDHRIGLSIFNLEQFMSGRELLDGLIEDLQKESRKERLQEIIEEHTSEIEKGKKHKHSK